MDQNVTFCHLLGILKEFMGRWALRKCVSVGYFPYTEPSVEPESIDGLGWVELGGAGCSEKRSLRPLASIIRCWPGAWESQGGHAQAGPEGSEAAISVRYRMAA